MKACNISECLAVSEHSHVFRQLRYWYQKRKTFVAVYSDFWESVAGKTCGDWYRLPTQVIRKPLSDIASKNALSTENDTLCWIISMKLLSALWMHILYTQNIRI